MKVIIAGGRYFDDYNELCCFCEKYSGIEEDIINEYIKH